MHKKKYIEFLEKKLDNINFENIKLKEQLNLTSNKHSITFMPLANPQVKITTGNCQNNPNQLRPVNNNNINNNNSNNNNFPNSNNTNNIKFSSISPNICSVEANNMLKSNVLQSRISAINPLISNQLKMNNNNHINLLDLGNIKKIEQKKPDRSSNKNTGFQDKSIYMEHVKTDNLNASTAKNIRSSPQIMIRNPNLNSNQKNLIQNNLSNNNNHSFQPNNDININYNNLDNINSNVNMGTDETFNYEKNLYKQSLSK
jgi:hypothetical protein